MTQKIFLAGMLTVLVACQASQKHEGPVPEPFTEAREDAFTLPSVSWRLTELMGKKIEQPADSAAAIVIRFDAATGQVTGFAGCNHFFGSYQETGPGRVRLEKIASTMKACTEGETMDNETTLLRLLETVDNYALNGRTLSLHRARMAPLARFEALAE